MTLSKTISLFAVLFLLAAVPSLSVFTIAARTAAWGWLHGVLTSAGIIVGDICFIILAIFGLGILFGVAQDWLFLLKIMAGIYLILLSLQLWRSTRLKINIPIEDNKPSFYASFILGLFITLGDQKAIFFYLGFFPLFIHTQQLTIIEMIILIITATLAVGSAKLSYVYLIHRAQYFIHEKQTILLKKISAFLIAMMGIILITSEIDMTK